MAHASVVGMLLSEIVLVGGGLLGTLSFGTGRTKALAGSPKRPLGIPSSEGGRTVALGGTAGQLPGILNPIRKVGPLYSSRIHGKEMVPYC